MKILVIGSGWYGCHIAYNLLKYNHDVIMIDKSNEIFTGSSLKNQNRLHLGFHYPRSKETINECLKGYFRFLEEYPFLTEELDKNYYFIAKNSLLSYQDYIENISLLKKYYTKEYYKLSEKLENSCLNVKERYINFNKSKEFFEKNIGHIFKRIDSEVFISLDTIKKYFQDKEYIINCTYNHLEPFEFSHYELYISLIYKKNDNNIENITIMDGNFYSLYYYEEDKYSLTSVEHGVLYKGKEILPEEEILKKTDVKQIIKKIEEDVQTYIPFFKDKFQYHSFFLSWKTKPITNTDDRSVKMKKENNVISIYGGKITGIFNAWDLIKMNF